MEKPSAKGHVIQVNPVHIFITPLGFHTYAADFLTAARDLKPSDHFSPVPYYLCCRSIELSLKSFFLGKGVTKKILKKKLGHDLVKTLKWARKAGISDVIKLSPAQENCIRKANEYYTAKGFEYFELANAIRGYSDRPALEELDGLAAELVSKLKKYCMDVADHPP